MENLGFRLDNCQGNWRVKMQEDSKESKPTRVGVAPVFVLLESNYTDDVKQPKCLGNC